MTPRRYQSSRRKGWKKPEGARMVTRPNRWSNPHPMDVPCPVERCAGIVHDRPGCVAAFEEDLRAGTLRTCKKGVPIDEPHGIPEARAELAGLDLVCACGLTEQCHADLLIRYARTEGSR